MELYSVRDILERQKDIETATGAESRKAWVSRAGMERLFGCAVTKYGGVASHCEGLTGGPWRDAHNTRSAKLA